MTAVLYVDSEGVTVESRAEDRVRVTVAGRSRSFHEADLDGFISMLVLAKSQTWPKEDK